MKLTKLVVILIILALVYVLVAPFIAQASLAIGINISPLVVCVVLLMVAWAVLS